MNRAFPLAILLCASAPALAANDPWEAPFLLRIGAMNAEASTTVRLDSDGGRLGTQVSFEGDLNVDEKKVLPTFDLTWRLNPRHALEASVVSLRREGSRTLSGQIDFGDASFPVSSVVNSKFDSDIVRAAWRYSFIHEPGGELALLLGLHYTRMLARVATATGTIEEEASVKYPLPTIGLRGSANFAGNFRVTGFGQLLQLKINDYDGGIVNWGAGVEWAFAPNMLGGIGYEYYKYDLESTKSGVRGTFEYRFDGPTLYFGWSFR